MKIVHFLENINIGGGIASFVSNLTSIQVRENLVAIAVVNEQNKDLAMPFPEGIEIINMGKSKPGFSIKYPIYILRFLANSDYDIVHLHSSFLYYCLSVILLHKKMKFVYTVHSDAVKENSSKWDRMFWKLKKMCFKRDYIRPVTISDVSKKSFDDLYGMKSHMIYNGVKHVNLSFQGKQLSQWRYTTNTKLFLHPGRISEAKNQVTLCASFQNIINRGYDVVLLIAGTKQDEVIYGQIEKYFSDRIVYIGERTDIIELLTEVDAMCLSSIWEGLPITLLESLSVGCVPICTPVGGIPNVIKDGESGIIANSTNVVDYTNALIRFMELPAEQLSNIQDNAKNTFRKFDIKHTANNYQLLYNQILS